MKLNGKLFSFREVSHADPKPGLYAWYLMIKLGKANIKSSKPENFLRRLKTITEQLCYPTLPVQIQGRLSPKMKGDLGHIWYGHEKYPFPKRFREILSCPEEREILGEMLESAVPLLTSPLYIGVSKNLQIRLEQHKQLLQEYQRHKRLQQEHQEDTIQFPLVDSAKALKNDKNFAQRIVNREINLNDLVVSIVPNPRPSSEKVHRAIGAAETLLNRIFYPILGRR